MTLPVVEVSVCNSGTSVTVTSIGAPAIWSRKFTSVVPVILTTTLGTRTVPKPGALPSTS